jgi:DtxR family Mn-dependent transcriptional regulator
MTVHDIAKTERVEMYLKAVYTVAHATPPVTISKVADYMGVSAPSSHEMLKRLEAQGLLRSGAEGYRLTPRGLATATRVVRRLRLAERLLTDVLRLDLPRVYAEACKLEHVISPEVEARLAEVLGHPATCPHGLPIPGNGPDDEEEPLGTLDQRQVWDRITIVSIPEEDERLVEHLVDVGVLPGTTVLVREIGPRGDPITVQIAHQIRAIGREAAARVRVRPAGDRAAERDECSDEKDRDATGNQ